eukprot:scaffold614_cov378-Pavlova_lutheri.AAC.12
MERPRCTSPVTEGGWNEPSPLCRKGGRGGGKPGEGHRTGPLRVRFGSRNVTGDSWCRFDASRRYAEGKGSKGHVTIHAIDDVAYPSHGQEPRRSKPTQLDAANGRCTEG